MYWLGSCPTHGLTGFSHRYYRLLEYVAVLNPALFNAAFSRSLLSVHRNRTVYFLTLSLSLFIITLYILQRSVVSFTRLIAS